MASAEKSLRLMVEHWLTPLPPTRFASLGSETGVPQGSAMYASRQSLRLGGFQCFSSVTGTVYGVHSRRMESG